MSMKRGAPRESCYMSCDLSLSVLDCGGGGGSGGGGGGGKDDNDNDNDDDDDDDNDDDDDDDDDDNDDDNDDRTALDVLAYGGDDGIISLLLDEAIVK